MRNGFDYFLVPSRRLPGLVWSRRKSVTLRRKDPNAGPCTPFHSLRRATTSILKNAGVSSAIVTDFVGHLDALHDD
jgi:hypothetical protein